MRIKNVNYAYRVYKGVKIFLCKCVKNVLMGVKKPEDMAAGSIDDEHTKINNQTFSKFSSSF